MTVKDYELTDPRPPALDLSVGAKVVYGSLGIGRVSSREGSDDGSLTVTVEFPSGLSVSVPLERATACFRPLAGALELDDVRDALRARDVPIEQSWQVRSSSTRSKISAGEAVRLAEVVRDTVQRKRNFSAGSSISPAEQGLYVKARTLLVAQVGAAGNLDEGEAEAWIDNQLEWTGE